MAGGQRLGAQMTAAVCALLALHATLAWWSTLHRSVTVDEIFHVTGGYIFDRFGDFRIHPDNGVLPQRLHALPAVLAGARPPPLEGNEYWRTSDVTVVSYQFFYESGNDHWPMLLAARAVNLCFGLATCALIFGWARRLGGDRAGLIALALAALSPTLLAHHPLATTDAAAALTLTASVGAFWWQLREGGWGKALLSAVAFGAACVTKYSAVLLVPIFLLLVLVDAVDRRATGGRAGWIIGSIALHAMMAWAIIWACFDFRFSAFAPGVPPADQFIRTWDWLIAHTGWQGQVIDVIRRHHLLPEAFLFGYTHTYAGSLVRSAFLAGDYSDTGWRSFFPLAFFWKSTPAELAAMVCCAGAAVLHWRHLRPWLLRFAPLLMLGAVYGAVALTSKLNIGHRHLLPMYPALFIVAGVGLAHLSRRAWLAGAFVAAQAFSAAQISPCYLAYFNVFAGGPDHAWRLLVDSSLDWGQDLGRLKTWLDRNNPPPAAQPVFLSYFGSGEPNYYKISATRMRFVNGFKFPLAWYEPTAGIYCISATILQEVYSPVRGPWTLGFEQDYQRLRALEPNFRALQNDPAARARLLATMPAAEWKRAWDYYEDLRHARLCAYLRARGPDATVGHSILIFRLTEEEIRSALRTPFSEWVNAVEAARSRARN